MATPSRTLAWRIPWMEEPGRLQSMGSLGVDNWETSLSLSPFMPWRRKWQPTPVLAWRVLGTGKPSGLPSLGSHRVRHGWSDLAAAYSIYDVPGSVLSSLQLSHLFFRTCVGRCFIIILILEMRKQRNQVTTCGSTAGEKCQGWGLNPTVALKFMCFNSIFWNLTFPYTSVRCMK